MSIAIFESLKSKTIISIEGLEKYRDKVIFECSDGTKFMMYHKQDCCESVSIEDVCGDIEDLINSEILVAEEVEGEDDGCGTWTFYKLATIKGSVTIRWYGTSNGYYSESVDFCKID